MKEESRVKKVKGAMEPREARIFTEKLEMVK